VSTAGGRGDIGGVVPPEVRELLRGQALVLQRPVWGPRHGRHPSVRTGVGLDFRDHRPYVPGDDPRMLDWRAIARRDRLVLRQTESEDELSLFLALDRSAAMAYGEGESSKAYVADAIAGALALLAIRQGDRVGLALGRAGDMDASLLRPLGGNDRLSAIAQVLQRNEPAGQCPWPRIIGRIAPRLARRSLLVLISDFLDPCGHAGKEAEAELLRGLARLRARDHDIILVQVLHRDEVEFPWADRRMIRFEDARGAREPVEGAGVRLREGYLARLRSHLERLDHTCERDGLFLHRVVSDDPVAEALVTLLGRLAGSAPAQRPLIEARP
jgi:uncharacterized protein (DUF58 family)